MKQIKFLLTASLLVLAFSPLAMAQAPRVTLPVSETQLESAPDGPFQATWESIENNYQVPEWFKDAKFGIFIHWGPYVVPAAGSEWYPKHMYNGLKEHHREHWGHQDEFGYKDFIPMFRAEKFDADEWAQLFKDAGARYVIPTAEHHDGFAMYDSDLTEWNAVKHGPKKDVIGMLAKAVRGKGLKFGVSNHRVENWDFMYPGIPADSTDLFNPLYAGLYGPPQKPTENSGMGPGDNPDARHPQNDAFMDEWQVRVMEIIDRYQPDLLYFDNGINYRSMDPWKLRIARYYYNSAEKWGKQVSIQSKSDAYKAGTIRDFERESRAPKENVGYYWQVDDPIGHKFGYVEGLKLQKADGIIKNLINNISRNGNLCLNISPKADGTIPEDQKKELLAVGEWLGKYGEAVYSTRGYGENRDGNVRYTSKGRHTLYAFLLDWDGQEQLLPDVSADKVEDISRLDGEKVSWRKDGDKVYVKALQGASDGPATVLKIKVEAPKTALFIGDSITDGGWGRSGGSAAPASKRNHWDQNHHLGHSYVIFCAGRAMADNPELDWQWLNRGISGNTLHDIKKRWNEDVLAFEPDILTILIGTNDVMQWLGEDTGKDFDVEGWTQEYASLLKSAKEMNPDLKIVLISPFVSAGRSVRPETLEKQQAAVDRLAMATARLAKENGASYVDANSLFHKLTDGNPHRDRWLWDGIHPTPAGHQRLADLWLKATKKNF